MRVAWIDCSAGASGDMLLGAFLDAGADLAAVNAAVAAVDPSLSVTVDQTSRHQIAATKASVRVEGELHPENFPDTAGHAHGEGHGDGHGHGHGHGQEDAGHRHGGSGTTTRTWAEVRRLIEAAGLADPVRARALDTFARLARAEATAHGVEPDAVHFHEVGALDAIADIVGVAAASVSLELDRIVVSTISLGGGGQVRGQHGGVPVPGPAVLHLLSEAEAPVVGGTAPYEMTTPTGAALLASLADEFGLLP
ncbi:MAG TPA: LarC family nickel insertion protein, partial [Kribbella sp.]